MGLLGALVYFFYFRSLVIQAYENMGPEWLNKFIYTFYPRFFVEKHRFDPEFFLSKADQMVLRILVFLMIITIWGQKIYDRIFNRKFTSEFNLNVFRWVIYLSASLFYWDFLIELNKLNQIKEFYQPILFNKVFMTNFPSMNVLYILFGLMVFANILAFLNRWLIVFGLIFAFCFVLLQGVFLSFHKIDHGFATYIYCLLLFPLVGIIKKSTIQASSDYWPIRLIWVAITLSYLMSGLEKLTISGWNWFQPSTLKGYLSLHNTTLGLFVIQYEWLCVLLSIGGLVFQLGFVSILFRQKLLWFFVPAGIFFHFMTGQLFQITGLLSPWQLVYVFFIDWEKAWEIISNNGFLYKITNTKKG